MERTIDIENERDRLNPWVRRSIELFSETPYLDNIREIYPFGVAQPQRLPDDTRREIIMAHNNRNTQKLIEMLTEQVKFPYEDPVWFMIKNIQGCLDNNPEQLERIAQSLYSMTANETIFRIEAPPAINTQIGPMFRAWMLKNFESLRLGEFERSGEGIYVLDASEEEGKQYVYSLGQNLDKRPDLIAKVNKQIIIGEAKWIGQPGGNQEKQVREILRFCAGQKAMIRRIGIVDGFPWAVYRRNGKIIKSKEAVLIQESPYDVLSALLLEDYLKEAAI